MSKEAAVRESLKSRPAGIVRSLSKDADRTFAALFNGAMTGRITKIGVWFGKAEAEWGWPDAWNELQNLGLIEFDIVDGRVPWSVTKKGHDARDDDLAYFRELMNAMDEDEPTQNVG